MPSNGQRIPSLIFCAGSTTSLTSMVSAADENSPTPRRFSRLNLESLLAKTKAPRLPRRQSSRGMGFRKNSSLLGMNSGGSSTMNAKFDLGSPRLSGSSKQSLFDKFSSMAPMLSPALSESSRKTKASVRSSDTPLTLPRRKPSQPTFVVPPQER